MGERRGQAWSVDLVIGVLIFLLVVGLFYALLSGNRDKDTSELTIASEVVATKLVTSPGDAIIEEDIVNKVKLLKLAKQAQTEGGYEQLKRQFGIDSEFCIYFEDENGNLINITGDDGSDTWSYNGIGSGSEDLKLSGNPCGAGSISS